MKLHEALDLYLIEKEKTLKAYSYFTIAGKAQSLKKLIKNEELEEINIQEYINSWTKKYAFATIKNFYSILKQTFKMEGIQFEFVLPKMPKKKKEYYSSEEIERIEKYLVHIQLKQRQLVLPIAIYTGCRLGEILGLQWKNVDLEKGFIEINKNVVRIKGKGVIIQTPKTETSYRTIPIPQQLISILNKFKPDTEKYDTFIISGEETPLSSRSAEYIAEVLITKAGIKWKGMHAFRHSYASKLLENNVQPKIASELLGHSNIQTTMNIYAHASNEMLKKNVDQIYNVNESSLLKKLTELEKMIKDLKEELLKV